jgi:hypothetical protein
MTQPANKSTWCFKRKCMYPVSVLMCEVKKCITHGNYPVTKPSTNLFCKEIVLIVFMCKRL